MPQSKRSAKAPARVGPTVGGLALAAADTGRVLMLQRAYDGKTNGKPDPAAGKWEFPGGHLEDDDPTSLHGAMREWGEEIGREVPPGGAVAHIWTSPNGVYAGHLVVIPSESMLDLGAERTLPNPDDDSEQSAWWSLDDARRNPALREECRGTPWAAIGKVLDGLRTGTKTLTVDTSEGGDILVSAWRAQGVEVKAKVASKAGEQRYGLPIGTELGQARDQAGKEAQANAKARDLYETLVNASPKDYRAMLDGLSKADLTALGRISYSFRSSNPTVVQARIAVANAMRRQGLDVNSYGGLGRSGGSTVPGRGKPAAKGKAGAKRPAGKTTAPRSRTPAKGRAAAKPAGHTSTNAKPVTEGQVSQREWDNLMRAGWKGRAGDGAERLYPPGYKHGEPDELEVKHVDEDDLQYKARTTTKPWETRSAQRGGKTIGKEKSTEKDGGDEWPVKTIGDIAAGVKRAKSIKDPERLKTVRAHLRAGAKAIGGPAVNMIPKDWGSGDSGSGGKSDDKGKSGGGGFVPFKKGHGKKDSGVVLESGDMALLAAIEAKVMSPDANATRLREYWAHGEGRAKWRPGSPGDFERLRRAVRKYVPAHMLNGFVANVHKLATGEWPGKNAHGGKTGEPEGLEIKAADLAVLDAWDDDDPDAVDLALDRFGDMESEVTAEDEYERALADEIDWTLEMDGEIHPEGGRSDDDEDDGPAGKLERVRAGVAAPGNDGDAGLAALDELFA